MHSDKPKERGTTKETEAMSEYIQHHYWCSTLNTILLNVRAKLNRNSIPAGSETGKVLNVCLLLCMSRCTVQRAACTGDF